MRYITESQYYKLIPVVQGAKNYSHTYVGVDTVIHYVFKNNEEVNVLEAYYGDYSEGDSFKVDEVIYNKYLGYEV